MSGFEDDNGPTKLRKFYSENNGFYALRDLTYAYSLLL
jgi:hypothetical protein